jgi:hypothetical protein
MPGCLEITLVNMVPVILLVMVMVFLMVVFFGLCHKFNATGSLGREKAGEAGRAPGVFATTVICGGLSTEFKLICSSTRTARER